MASNAPRGCIERYVMPRNPALPDVSLREVVYSPPLFRNAKGQVTGDAVPLYRGDAPKVAAMVSPGTLYEFRLGWLYVVQGPNSPAEWMFSAAKEAAMFAAPGVGELAGPFSEIVTEVTRKVIEEIPTNRSEREQSLKGASGDVAAELEKRGAVCAAGVDLVEIAYYVDAPGFLSSKEVHRCVMTYERRDGQRTIYTLAWRGANGQRNVNAIMTDMITARRDGEFDQLVYRVASEYLDVYAIARAKVEEYQTRFGDQAEAHRAELVADLDAAYKAELDRAGYSEQRAAATALERLAPLIPHYEKVPLLNEAVGALRKIAADEPR